MAQEQLKQRQSDTPDYVDELVPFSERHPVLDPVKITGVVVLCFLLTIIATYNTEDFGQINVIASLIFLFSGLAIFFGLLTMKIKEVVMANEFQNALFSGANNAGVEFAIILNRSGEVIYLSPGCRKYFREYTEIKGQDFETILTRMGIDEMDRIHLLSASQAFTDTTRHAQMIDAFGFQQDVYMILRTISRPYGFLTLKAVKLDQIRAESDMLEGNTNPEIVRLLDSVPVPGYLATAKGTILYTNNRLTKLLGYEKGEIVDAGLTLDEISFGHEVMEEDMLSDWDGVMALKHKDDHKPIKVRLRQVPLKHDEERSPLICGFIDPVSMPKLATGAPQIPSGNVNEIWSKILENTVISLAFLDADGYITQCNKAFRAITGHEITKGWHINDILPEDKRPEVRKRMKEIFITPEKPVAPLEILVNDSDKKSALLYLSPFGDGADGFVAQLVDVTRQKRFEQTIVQTQKMQAVGQLAGGIAHDFNNLLTAMIGFCDLLLIRHPPGEPSFPDIMQIKQNANRAANLVRQLLAFSRKQTLQLEVIDVTEALADLSNLIIRLIGENIDFKIIHGRNLDLIKVDKVQFEQVMINLAVNARDAMDSKGTLIFTTNNVKIDRQHPINKRLIPASVEDVIEDGEYVLIEVTDSGKGIDPSIMGQIFNPFFSTKEIGSGTGLGLATVYGIVKQTGGYVYLRSEVGKGSTFSIFFKKANREEARKFHEKPHDGDEKVDIDLTGKGTILLVEDEAPVRTFSVRALQNKGYNVLEAENAEAALGIVAANGDSIDLIVTDVMMPGIDGPTMIKQVYEKYPDIKVIFISGYAEDVFIKNFGSERGFNFLPKPYSLKDLASKVKEIIGK